MDTLKVIAPNKDILEIIKAIVEQHNEIIKINANLMSVLTTPLITLEPTKEASAG